MVTALPTVDDLAGLIRQHTLRVASTMLALTPDHIAETAAATVVASDGVVVALVGLTGTWTGSGSLTCSGALAKALSGRLLMTAFDHVDAEVLDAMGELANMVVGNVKEDLAPLTGALGISTPTVIHGADLQTRSPIGQVSSRVRFVIDEGVLDVHVALSRAAVVERPRAVGE